MRPSKTEAGFGSPGDRLGLEELQDTQPEADGGAAAGLHGQHHLLLFLECSRLLPKTNEEVTKDSIFFILFVWSSFYSVQVLYCGSKFLTDLLDLKENFFLLVKTNRRQLVI